MKEFKPLTESQLELLEMKVMQIQDVTNQAQNIMDQATALQKQNMNRIERMKSEPGVDIPEVEIEQWQLSKDGKNFEREKEIKKTTIKGNKKKK
jgi:hypothetical protein